MLPFFFDWLTAVGLLLGFGIAGVGAVASFTSSRDGALGAAPLAGALLIPFGTNAVYSVFGLSYSASAMLAATGCVALGAVNSRGIRRADIIRPALTLVVVASAAAFACDAAAFRAGDSAILFTDGTDHAGYAHVADWLRDHSIRQGPRSASEHPYESWPAYMFAVDPRFGTYGLLAIVSTVRGVSALFAYDLTFAIALAAGAMAVASMFTRSVAGLALLIVGLLISHWYDYGHTGYLGKVVAYPAALFLVGLTFKAIEKPSAQNAFFLFLLASAAGAAYPGTGTAVLILPILAAAALVRWHADRKIAAPELWMCCVAVLAPVVASGILARPLSGSVPDYGLTWFYILPRLADLESQGVAISGAGAGSLVGMLAISVMVWCVFLALAIQQRNATATGLLAGPLVLIFAFFVTDARATAFQTIGFLYPAILCGACALLDDLEATKRQTMLAAALLLVALRLPRASGAVDRYALNPESRFIFTAGEAAGLAAAIGDASAVIEVSDPQRSLMLLVELGRRPLRLQWSEAAWNAILRYRGWAWPGIVSPEMAIRPAAGARHFTADSYHSTMTTPSDPVVPLLLLAAPPAPAP